MVVVHDNAHCTTMAIAKASQGNVGFERLICRLLSPFRDLSNESGFVFRRRVDQKLSRIKVGWPVFRFFEIASFAAIAFASQGNVGF